MRTMPGVIWRPPPITALSETTRLSSSSQLSSQAVSCFSSCLYDVFLVMALASAASFYAHVYLDKEYHVEPSRLERFAWFRRKQPLHFVHHLHADSNFAVIDFLLGPAARNLPGARLALQL